MLIYFLPKIGLESCRGILDLRYSKLLAKPRLGLNFRQNRYPWFCAPKFGLHSGDSYGGQGVWFYVGAKG